MRHPAELLLALGSLLVLTGVMVNAVTLDDRSRHPAAGSTWRARFVAENRRRPVVRGIQLGSWPSPWCSTSATPSWSLADGCTGPLWISALRDTFTHMASQWPPEGAATGWRPFAVDDG